MRIAYVLNQHPKVSHTFIRREIAALKALGAKVDRISMRGSPDPLKDPADIEEARLTRIVLREPLRLALSVPTETRRRPRAVLEALRLALRLGRRAGRRLVHLVYLAEACRVAELCRKDGVTHLHAHFGTNSAAVAMLAGVVSGLPYSLTVHGPEEFDRPDTLALDEKIGRAAFTLAVSDFGRSQLFRWAALERWSRIHVVRCGLDLARFEDAAAPAGDAPALVCVGRLCEQKGQLLLLDAIARIAPETPGLRLTLVGDGELRPLVERRVAELGLEEVVEITGWADEAEVRRRILAARALVLPSFAEGLPVVLMEALALGRPVVSTYVAGIPELVDASCGWIVPAGSVDALTAALRDVLSADPARLDALGREGRRRVADRHDASAEGRKLFDLVQSAVARG